MVDETGGATAARDADERGALERLEARTGHRFADRELLAAAVTHRSRVAEAEAGENYERLEYLGDAVLGLLAADWLLRAFPEEGEGQLSRLKGYLVSEPVLARFARDLDLGAALRLGIGEERSGGREKPSLLADAFEALLGALYLDGGLEAAARVAAPLLEQGLASYERSVVTDAKTALQELLQARGAEPPEYRLVEESGPDHVKHFRVECWGLGRRLGGGEGTSKKRAEQAAAAAALADLRE
jgi:ribonuclease III